MSSWKEKVNGVWSMKIGNGEKLTPLSIVGKEPKFEAIEQMEKACFPSLFNNIEVIKMDGRTVIAHKIGKSEKIYGFGLQFYKMNHRGRTRYLRVNSDPKQDTGETHAPVPFYVSSKGYGLLINTSRIVTIYCGSCARQSNSLKTEYDRNVDKEWQGTPISDTIEIVIPGDRAELILFSGNCMLDVVRRYNLYCGGGVIPPRWGLGFWHRVPTLYDNNQVEDEAMEFRKREYPCDVIGLEPGWHSKSYPVTYEWSKSRFPNPTDFVQRMNENGFKINLWENPYVSSDAKIYDDLKPLSGSHTVWNGLAPDSTLTETKNIIKRQHRNEHVKIGVSGYKIDECDGSELTGASWMFPGHSRFPSGYDGEQMRQIYGLSYQKLTDELFREENKRTYGLVRASNAGASSLPYVLYSDLYGHKEFVRALCNAGFSGLLWTPEVRMARSAGDWVRRMQTVCFSPLAMLNAWEDGTKPWSYPQVSDIVKKYISLRMKLMPYIYSAFARYYFDGTPPFRATELDMDVEYVDDELMCSEINSTDAAYGKAATNSLDDQYMMGDGLLIAPLFDDETERKVYLPKGNWYDFYTGQRFEGGKYIYIEADLDKIPIYVKEGVLIPTMQVMQSAPKKGETVEIKVLHYGNAAGEFNLYDDDGETFDYGNGKYNWIKLSAVMIHNETFEYRASERKVKYWIKSFCWRHVLYR